MIAYIVHLLRPVLDFAWTWGVPLAAISLLAWLTFRVIAGPVPEGENDFDRPCRKGLDHAGECER